MLITAAPLIPLFMVLVGWRARAASEAQWLQMSSMNAFLLDRLRGLPTLRALGSVQTTARRLRASAEDLRQRTMKVLRIAFLSSAVLELFSALGVAMVAAYVGFHLLGYLEFGAWGGRLTLGEGLFILLLAPAFFEPLRELAAVWHDRAAGVAAMDALARLNENGLPLLDGAPAAQPGAEKAATDSVPSALHDRPAPDAVKPTSVKAASVKPASVDPASPQRPAPDVRLTDLGFAFPDEKPVFQHFSLAVRPGEHVALVGGSGTGKTVLMSLLAGLLVPTSGRIEIDGHDIREWKTASVRRQIGLLPQDALMFAASIRDNLASAAGRKVSDAEIIEAAKLANAHDFITALPEGYDTVIGERGATLSGGQRQRLAIARLALRRCPIVVLDEPTTGLDRASEAVVRHAITRLIDRRTALMITHDLDLASQADRIVYVDQGGIAESGTHEELLKNDGPYAALWQIHRQAVGDLQAKAALADTGSDT